MIVTDDINAGALNFDEILMLILIGDEVIVHEVAVSPEAWVRIPLLTPCQKWT